METKRQGAFSRVHCSLFCTCSHTRTIDSSQDALGSPRGGWSPGLRDRVRSTWDNHRELWTKSGCHLSLFVPGVQHSALCCPGRGESSQPINPAQGGLLQPQALTWPPETHPEVSGISGGSSKACEGLWGQRRDRTERTGCTFGNVQYLGTWCLCSIEESCKKAK